MEENQKQKRNPFNVMIDPRGFMRQVMARKKTAGWFLAFMTGTVWIFGKAYAFDLGLQFSLTQILIGSLVLSIPVGYGLIHLVSLFLYWTGKIFNGKSEYSGVYQAYLWTRVPELFFLLSWLGLIAIFGGNTFTPFLSNAAFVPPVVMALIGLQVIFAFWQVIILLHALGEVQGLSSWIAIWNVLLTWIIMMVLDAGFNMLVAKIDLFKPLAIWGWLHL